MEAEFNWIGTKIKRERKNQLIKQEALARGICSVSYLSKLENGKIEPNNEVLSLLLKRLNLNIEDLYNNNEDSEFASLQTIYEKVIQTKDRNYVHEKIQFFRELEFTEINNHLLLKLYLCRLKLIDNQLDSELDEILYYLKKEEKRLSLEQTFLLKVCFGLRHYHSGKTEEALILFEEILRIFDEFKLKKWEIADFYNILSVTYLKNRDYYNTVLYSLKALNYFKDNHLFLRTIDCYVTLSIAHRNIGEYEKAKEYLYLAQHLSTSTNTNTNKGLLFHNLGSLYAVQGFHNLAIENYIKSFEIKIQNRQQFNSLSTILCILKEYTKLNLPNEVVKWSKTGLEIINETGCNQSYFYHFQIYRSRFEKNLDFEDITKAAIKYFERIKDKRYVQKYCILLGNFYYEENKYKLANKYYQKANEKMLEQKLIKSVEDL